MRFLCTRLHGLPVVSDHGLKDFPTKNSVFVILVILLSSRISMPPKRTSQARAKPTTVSKQKKRRTSMNLEVASPALSPDVLETITAHMTQRVTATIRDELTALINNINSNSASNSQGSISINPLVASNNDDNDGLVTESRHLDNAIQHSVEAVVVDHTEKIAGKCPTGFVSTAVPIDARVSDNLVKPVYRIFKPFV